MKLFNKFSKIYYLNIKQTYLLKKINIKVYNCNNSKLKKNISNLI